MLALGRSMMTSTDISMTALTPMFGNGARRVSRKPVSLVHSSADAFSKMSVESTRRNLPVPLISGEFQNKPHSYDVIPSIQEHR